MESPAIFQAKKIPIEFGPCNAVAPQLHSASVVGHHGVLPHPDVGSDAAPKVLPKDGKRLRELVKSKSDNVTVDRKASVSEYRDRLKSMQILLSRTDAGPGRTGKQEQEQTSHNYVQAF